MLFVYSLGIDRGRENMSNGSENTCTYSHLKILLSSAQLSNHKEQHGKQENSPQIHAARISSSSHVLNVQTLNVPDPMKQVHPVEARF